MRIQRSYLPIATSRRLPARVAATESRRGITANGAAWRSLGPCERVLAAAGMAAAAAALVAGLSAGSFAFGEAAYAAAAGAVLLGYRPRTEPVRLIMAEPVFFATAERAARSLRTFAAVSCAVGAVCALHLLYLMTTWRA